MNLVAYRVVFCVASMGIFWKGSAETLRMSAKKCKEYAELVYRREALPTLRITGKTNSISKCPHMKTPLIVGGVKASPQEFPHQAIIGYGKNISWQCGGSIISESYILTAAHCIESYDREPAFKIRVGLINLKDPGYGMQERTIVERIKHPGYRIYSRNNDIALIKLDEPLELNDEVRPACLELNATPFERLIASGFGRTSYDATVGSDDLMKVTLDYVPTELCDSLLGGPIGGKLNDAGLSSSHLCAGVLEGGKDTCQGDSGGPLQRALAEPYCMYSIVGITSFGKFCAFKNSPAVYTRVSSYLDWIENTVWWDENSDSAKL